MDHLSILERLSSFRGKMYCHYIGWCIRECPLYRGVLYYFIQRFHCINEYGFKALYYKYLALTLLISFTFEKIIECCVLSNARSDSVAFGSIFGSSINVSISVVRLRWYVASDVMISKMA